jgi:DNA (cytosine-5)-methyltransferase 1
VRALVADTADAEPQVAASHDTERGQRSTERRRAVVATGTRTGCRTGDGRDAPRDGRPAGEVPVPVPYVDVLCGGFPCQDISLAGRGAGLAGERSGLWRHFARIIGELRPRYVIVENVPALTSRGLSVVLGDLAACGFDAEWDHLPASAFGAPHRRDRIWLVAYPASEHGGQGRAWGSAPGGAREPVAVGALQDADLADSGSKRQRARPGRNGAPAIGGERHAESGRSGGWLAQSDLGGMAARVSPWLDEPDVGRVAVGVPQRADRLRALGNALVPQIAEWIGTQIINWEKQNDKKGQAA